MGDTIWYIIVCYLEPGDGVMIWDVELAITERVKGAETIFVGDFNLYLEVTDGQGRDEETTAAMVTTEIEDPVGNLLPRVRVWCKYRITW